MKRFLTAFTGICMLLFCCVVPSFAASSTPSYPSGSAFSICSSVSPTNKPSTSSSNFYTAVTANLSNGFQMLGKGMYTLQTNTNTINTNLTGFKTALVGSLSSFSSLAGVSSGLADAGFSGGKGALAAINENVFYGFRSMFKGLGSINTSIGTLDDHLTTMSKNMDSNFTSLGKKLDTNYQGIVKVLAGYNTASQYQVLDTSVTGGFPMIHQWFSEFYDVLFDPLDEELKDKTEDQKNEVLDNFYGDDSKGVQSGQIGSLGDISSSAGNLLDTGGNIGNVFSEIGNTGSSVWSWFSSDNAMATLTESTAQADSRIADNLRFSSIWTWRIFYMPRYFKYFDTTSMPDRPILPVRYSDHADPDLSPKSIKEMLKDVFSKAREYFGRDPL